MREILDIVSVSSNTLLNLVNGILDLSKLEFQGNQFTLDQAPISLTDVVEQSIEVVYPTADKRRIQLVAILNHDLDLVVGDENRVRQILVNFLSNAIKFTNEQGAVSLTVSSTEPQVYLVTPDKSRQQRVLDFHTAADVDDQALVAQIPRRICDSPALNLVAIQEHALVRPSHQPDSEPCSGSDMTHVFFQVRDTGIGIEQEKIHLLFEKFQQLDSTIARQFQGTGLGLAIASRLVELHHGQIVVDSVPGIGSLFTMMLCFPSLAQDRAQLFLEQARAPVPSASSGLVTPAVVLVGLRVGLVVLNDLDRQAIQALLGRLGCTTVCMEFIPEYHQHLESSNTWSNVSNYPFFSVLLVDASAPVQSQQGQARLLQWSLQMPIIGIIPLKKPVLASAMADIPEIRIFDGGVISKPLRLKTLERKLCTVMSEFQHKSRSKSPNNESSSTNTSYTNPTTSHCTSNTVTTTTTTTTTMNSPMPHHLPTFVSTEAHSPSNMTTSTRTKLVPRPPPTLPKSSEKTARYVSLRKDTVRAEYSQFEPLHILVVDDNSVNQMVAVRILKSIGVVQVKTAINGAEAVTHAATHTDLDVIFMDVFMPVMDGLEATKIIIKNMVPTMSSTCSSSSSSSSQPTTNLNQRVPFICAMTASAFPEERTTCLNSGMHDFVSKPLRQADLVGVLMRYVQWRDQQPIS